MLELGYFFFLEFGVSVLGLSFGWFFFGWAFFFCVIRKVGMILVFII